MVYHFLGKQYGCSCMYSVYVFDYTNYTCYGRCKFLCVHFFCFNLKLKIINLSFFLILLTCVVMLVVHHTEFDNIDLTDSLKRLTGHYFLNN